MVDDLITFEKARVSGFSRYGLFLDSVDLPTNKTEAEEAGREPESERVVCHYGHMQANPARFVDDPKGS
jgi:hypothetical protein